MYLVESWKVEIVLTNKQTGRAGIQWNYLFLDGCGIKDKIECCSLTNYFAGTQDQNRVLSVGIA